MLLLFYSLLSLHPNRGSLSSRLRTLFPRRRPHSCLRDQQAGSRDMSGGSTRQVRFLGVDVVGSDGGGCSPFLFCFASPHALSVRRAARLLLSGAAVGCSRNLSAGGNDAPGWFFRAVWEEVEDVPG